MEFMELAEGESESDSRSHDLQEEQIAKLMEKGNASDEEQLDYSDAKRAQYIKDQEMQEDL